VKLSASILQSTSWSSDIAPSRVLLNSPPLL
jgi:hypothetical protein